NGPMRQSNPSRLDPLPEKSSKTERAARQQGSSILRENSSNGGKPSELSGCIVGAGKGSVKDKYVAK
ncbi:MAG: hypothetical protein WBE41_27380, partial [Terracidiphilus sp.]